MELRDARFVHFQTISDLFHRQLLPIVQDNNLLFTLAEAGKSATQNLALLTTVAEFERVGRGRRETSPRRKARTADGLLSAWNLGTDGIAIKTSISLAWPPSGPAPLNVGISSWGRRQHLTHGV